MGVAFLAIQCCGSPSSGPGDRGRDLSSLTQILYVHILNGE